jgi:hypothetical protein
VAKQGLGSRDAEQVRRLAEPLRKNGYGAYLLQFLQEYKIQHSAFTQKTLSKAGSFNRFDGGIDWRMM